MAGGGGITPSFRRAFKAPAFVAGLNDIAVTGQPIEQGGGQSNAGQSRSGTKLLAFLPQGFFEQLQ